MKKFLRNNGLSIVWLGLFFTTLVGGQSFVGYLENNNDLKEHGLPAIGYVSYLVSAHFLEATMKNWESEFLQMFLFIVLTAFLYQKGSSESKKLDEEEAVDRDPRQSKNKKDAPWPVRRGGVVLKIYENSLSLAFFILFLAAFFLHAVGGAREYNQDQALHRSGEQVSTIGYLGTSRFGSSLYRIGKANFSRLG